MIFPYGDIIQRCETGKSLAQWVAIAKKCPEDRPRARLKWLKEKHGLLQNRAMHVLREAFPSEAGWDEPAQLHAALWVDAASRDIFEAVQKLALEFPGVVAVPTDADELLEPAKREAWSERLRSAMVLKSRRDANKRIAALLRASWDAS